MNTERHEAECGCTVIVVGGRFGEKPTTRIAYCPRHAAADEMYEAMKSRQNLDRSRDGWPKHWGLRHILRYADLVRAKERNALALADGDREVE